MKNQKDIERLQQTTKYYETLLRVSNNGVLITDANRNIIEVNDAFCLFIGQKRKVIIGSNLFKWLEIFSEDAAKNWIKLEKTVQSKQVVSNYEIQLSLNNEIRYFDVNASLLEEIDNKENGVIISAWHDITYRKYTEQTLQESEKRFRALIDKAADAMYLADMKGNIIDVNIQACECLGYSREELLSLKIFDLDAVSVRPDFKKDIWDRMTPGKPFTIEGEHIRKDGSTFPVEIRVHLTEIDGESAILGFARNITERKQAEAALKEEMNTAQRYLDIVGSMLVVVSSDRKVSLVNRKGCEVLGYNEDEIIGKDWFDNFLPERLRKQVGEVADRLFAGEVEPVEYYENPVLTKSGEEIIIAWHNTVLRDESGNITHLLSSGEDITDRKLVEAELNKHREHLEELVKERTTELEEKNEKLEYFNKLFVGREFRIKELRDRVKELEEKISE